MAVPVSEEQLFECSGSRNFAAAIVKAGPHSSVEELLRTVDDLWWHKTPVQEWLTAFASHPRVGDKQALLLKYGSEQAAALSETEDTILDELAKLSNAYEEKFGHVFMIFAPGKSIGLWYGCWIACWTVWR